MSKNKKEKNLIYEGKAKILYEGPEPGTVIQYFKDDATAFNGEKHEVLSGKGVLNNRISEYIMLKLEDLGINTHFIERLDLREQLVKACEIVPIEIIVRNISAGSFCKRFGVEEGMNFYRPVIEMCFKSDDLGDPLITDEHVEIFGWADPEEIDAMKNIAIRVNDFLSGMFYGVGIKLVDMKMEFGRVYDEEGNLYLLVADEISPDSCRLWDIESGDSLDKDRFRKDLGGLQDAYREVAKRLKIISDDDDDNIVDLNEARSEEKEDKETK